MRRWGSFFVGVGYGLARLGLEGDPRARGARACMSAWSILRSLKSGWAAMGLVVVLPFVLLWMRRRRAEMWRCLYSRGGVWIGAWNHDLRLYGYEV